MVSEVSYKSDDGTIAISFKKGRGSSIRTLRKSQFKLKRLARRLTISWQERMKRKEERVERMKKKKDRMETKKSMWRMCPLTPRCHWWTCTRPRARDIPRPIPRCTSRLSNWSRRSRTPINGLGHSFSGSGRSSPLPMYNWNMMEVDEELYFN